MAKSLRYDAGITCTDTGLVKIMSREVMNHLQQITGQQVASGTA